MEADCKIISNWIKYQIFTKKPDLHMCTSPYGASDEGALTRVSFIRMWPIIVDRPPTHPGHHRITRHHLAQNFEFFGMVCWRTDRRRMVSQWRQRRQKYDLANSGYFGSEKYQRIAWLRKKRIGFRHIQESHVLFWCSGNSSYISFYFW